MPFSPTNSATTQVDLRLIHIAYAQFLNVPQAPTG
jgi:hypothetical protein